ncbi:hypothetical protein B566_EDAN012135 [Ephemera danica]|nr:hypothetical protein B566_EDAN012135 [Ephemera danica]
MHVLTAKGKMEREAQEKCKPCKISKFYCPEKNQYLIENKVCETQVNTRVNRVAAALRNSKDDLECKLCSATLANSSSLYQHSYKKPKVEVRLPGFQFLDFLNPKFVDTPKFSDSPKGIIKVKKEPTEPPSQSVNSRATELCEHPYPVKIKLDIKDDIENIIAGLQTKGLLQDTPSMYCGVCRNVFCLETFVMHLIGCVQEVDFSCSFCQTTVGEGASADDRWGHIKLHLISLTPAGVGSGSVCVMCDELFLTEYNMALHAQFVHFL